MHNNIAAAIAATRVIAENNGINFVGNNELEPSFPFAEIDINATPLSGGQNRMRLVLSLTIHTEYRGASEVLGLMDTMFSEMNGKSITESASDISQTAKIVPIWTSSRTFLTNESVYSGQINFNVNIHN